MSSGNHCILTEQESSEADGLPATLNSDGDPPKLPIVTPTTTRHKCPACFKQYKEKKHLVEHMKISCHSVHDPKCGVCKKQCKSFESLREHIAGEMLGHDYEHPLAKKAIFMGNLVEFLCFVEHLGPLSKVCCSRIFAERGCSLCLKIFDSSDCLSQHSDICCLPAPIPIDTTGVPCTEPQIDDNLAVIPENDGSDSGHGREAVAIACALVGGGSDGSLDLCARVCLIDEDENIVFHTYVVPHISLTDYRYEITGITEEHMRDAMPLEEVREKILQILYNGESISKVRMGGGRAKALVGHSLARFLYCLGMHYPDHLLRDTSKYRPLTKTNFVSHSLKYLTKTYLGYDIHDGVHDPYQDSVTAMRLYKRMRSQEHQSFASLAAQRSPGFSAFSSGQLGSMTPDELLAISESNYRCWCLDSGRI
nr:RNA exonuclease 4 isoform X1 [Ipomoea batatas]